MLKFSLATFGIGWAFILAVALGLIDQDSRLGFVPLVFLMTSTLTGMIGGTEDEEYRMPFFALALISFGSCMAYAVLRYFMLFAWVGR